MTAQQPRNPPTLWLVATITFRPLPGIPDPPPPAYAEETHKLTWRPEQAWQYERAVPYFHVWAGVNTIDAYIGANIHAWATDPRYDGIFYTVSNPYRVTNWQPFTTEPHTILGMAGQSELTARFSEFAPHLTAPDAVTKCRGIFGNLGAQNLARTAHGLDIRRRVMHRTRPTTYQHTLNSRYQNAVLAWTTFTAPQRTAWDTVAANLPRKISGFSLFIHYTQDLRYEEIIQLERVYDVTLAIPPDPTYAT